MSMDLNISNQKYLILPFRLRLLRLGLLLVLGNFACAVFAQPMSASGAGNGKLVKQNSSAIGGMHAVVPTGPQREMPVYRISDYAQGRDDLTPGQIKIGFALTRMDMVTRDKYRAATLALIAKTHDDVNFPLFKGKPLTPLTNAAVMGESEIVAALLAKGAEVNKVLPGEDSTPALIGAVSGTSYAYRDNPVFPLAERYVETVKVLLKAGADPNATCCGGKTAMSFALTFSTHDPAGEKSKVEIVRALLESGAAPGTQIPALVGISTENSDEIIKLLLDHGLNPNAKDSIVLATAVHNRRYELVKMLLAKGADPNVPALSGGIGKRTVFADALVMGQADIALALIKAGANPNVCHDEDASGKCMNSTPFLFFLALPESELFHAMVAHGARLDAVDAQGQTALGYAISYVKNAISLVCEAGTNHCIQPPEDKFDRIAVVKMLLDAGADPNQKSAGHPPLLMAGDSDQEIVTLLLDKGARLENLRVQGEQIGPVSQALAARRLFLAKELLRRSKGKLERQAGDRREMGTVCRRRERRSGVGGVAHTTRDQT